MSATPAKEKQVSTTSSLWRKNSPILAAGAGASTKFVFEHGERIERVENVKDLKNYVERIDEMIERKRIGMEKYLPK